MFVCCFVCVSVCGKSQPANIVTGTKYEQVCCNRRSNHAQLMVLIGIYGCLSVTYVFSVQLTVKRHNCETNAREKVVLKGTKMEIGKKEYIHTYFYVHYLY